jgi:hypothetical protein
MMAHCVSQVAPITRDSMSARRAFRTSASSMSIVCGSLLRPATTLLNSAQPVHSELRKRRAKWWWRCANINR